MSSPPYMKLYVADYLGDTHHLGVVEHGAYLLLLMAMWRAGGSLPAADANLAKLARCAPDQWADIRDAVLPFFKRSRSRLTHKRLSEELAKYENTSGKRSAAGKQGASKKALKNNAFRPAIAIANDKQLPTYPEPEPDIDSEDKSSGGPAAELVVDLDALTWDLAVRLLRSQGAMPEKSARAFVGMLLAKNRIEIRDLSSSVNGALANATRDPQAYLTKAAAGVAKRRADTGPAKRVAFV